MRQAKTNLVLPREYTDIANFVSASGKLIFYISGLKKKKMQDQLMNKDPEPTLKSQRLVTSNYCTTASSK